MIRLVSTARCCSPTPCGWTETGALEVVDLEARRHTQEGPLKQDGKPHPTVVESHPEETK